MQTKSYTVDESSAERLFGTNRSYVTLVGKGPVIGLELAGANCINVTQQALSNLISTKYPNLPRKIILNTLRSIGKLLFWYFRRFYQSNSS